LNAAQNFLTEKSVERTDFSLVMKIPSAETPQNINSILMPADGFERRYWSAK